MKLVDAKDEEALTYARKIAVSKARYPADYVMSRQIATYRLY